jgi:hypothetical protein
MSDTEMPIMPSPNTIYASGNSLARFRHAFTTIQVFDRADQGRRLEVNDDGHIITFDLSAEQAFGLASLLSSRTS